jgi:hypothetical protein
VIQRLDMSGVLEEDDVRTLFPRLRGSEDKAVELEVLALR